MNKWTCLHDVIHMLKMSAHCAGATVVISLQESVSGENNCVHARMGGQCAARHYPSEVISLPLLATNLFLTARGSGSVPDILGQSGWSVPLDVDPSLP